ncbi:MAG: UDP-glucose/GDP-mannose dehydrogenase family protein [Pirellulaceae bacterium]
MKISVVGTGYVGLVTGTCFADSGNSVTCIDIDAAKIEALNNGKIPIYEPGLTELVHRNIAAKRLRFTTDLTAAVKTANIIYLAVGTPQGDDGSADLSALWTVAKQMAPHLLPDAIIVTKSTVPVGTNARLLALLKELTGRECRVASNPEFLKEGAAIDDFTKPDRVVVGVREEESAKILHKLYAPFLRTDKPFLVMSPESAELTKYVANALLATKISFINQMANLCEVYHADINDVRRGIGHDSRIGFAFLFPGVGYGGSCFPKDVRAMISTFNDAGIEPRILEAVDWVNQQQKLVLQTKIEKHFSGNLKGKTIAIWGIAFKPRTDDIREAPALVLIDRLLELGAKVQAHDPEANMNAQRLYGDKIRFCEQPMDALENADALAILTEWTEFRTPDFGEMKRLMAKPVIFDGRNLYQPETIVEQGFTYYSIGRTVVGA